MRGLILFVVLIGSCVAFCSIATEKGEERRAAQPVVGVTLDELVAECEANEVAFERKWENKSVRVTANVAEVNADVAGGTLQLATSMRYRTVSAGDLTEGYLAALHKGDSVTLICQSVRESVGRPRLYNCEPEP